MRKERRGGSGTASAPSSRAKLHAHPPERGREAVLVPVTELTPAATPPVIHAATPAVSGTTATPAVLVHAAPAAVRIHAAPAAVVVVIAEMELDLCAGRRRHRRRRDTADDDRCNAGQHRAAGKVRAAPGSLVPSVQHRTERRSNPINPDFHHICHVSSSSRRAPSGRGSSTPETSTLRILRGNPQDCNRIY